MSYDVIVIGGGPAGLSAAVNVRARGRSVLVVSNPLEENPLWKSETALSERYGITSIPTLILFKNGTEIDRRVGVVPESVLREILDANL